MTQPSSLLLVDSDLHGLETLTYGFEREGCKVTRTSDLSRAVQLARTGSPALAVVMLREPAQPALDVIAALRAHRTMPAFPILALGDVSHQTQARAAGAVDFLRTPTYIRDVVNVAKMSAYGDDAESLLSEYHGLFYLLRSMSATSRSCVLRLSRGQRRAEIRFKEGKVVSASVRALQHLPAIHHVLLWEEAAVSIAGGVVSKPSQFPLSAQEVLDECERFLRDFAHAARDLGPPNTVYVPAPEPRPAVTGMQPNQMVPLLRLFDGNHGLADVVEESPFRIFDTIRMIRRLVQGGVLVTRAQQRRATGGHQRLGHPTPSPNGAPQSMLGQWAMVPDQRGVVGDRRSPSRPLMPFGNSAPDQPGGGRDRRSPSRPVKPLATPGPTPLPTLAKRATPAPVLLTKPVSKPFATPGPTPLPTLATLAAPVAQPELTTPPPAPEPEPPPVLLTTPVAPPAAAEWPAPEPEPPPVLLTTPVAPPAAAAWPTPDQVLMGIPATEPLPMLAPQLEPEPPPIQLTHKKAAAAGEIPAIKQQPTAAGLTDLALGPTVQVKVDPDGVPLTLPALRPNTPAPERAPAPVARHKTPIPARVTPAAAFDAVEADFFAREADLYKREAVDTFDDLDHSGGGSGSNGGEKRPPTRRRRK